MNRGPAISKFLQKQGKIGDILSNVDSRETISQASRQAAPQICHAIAERVWYNIGWLSSQGASGKKFWYFFCLSLFMPDQSVKQTGLLPIIWQAMILFWGHSMEENTDRHLTCRYLTTQWLLPLNCYSNGVRPLIYYRLRTWLRWNIIKIAD